MRTSLACPSYVPYVAMCLTCLFALLVCLFVVFFQSRLDDDRQARHLRQLQREGGTTEDDETTMVRKETTHTYTRRLIHDANGQEQVGDPHSIVSFLWFLLPFVFQGVYECRLGLAPRCAALPHRIQSTRTRTRSGCIMDGILSTLSRRTIRIRSRQTARMELTPLSRLPILE